MTDAKIIDGRAFSEKLVPQVAAGVEIFSKAIGQVPGLAGVLGGEDPASQVYVRSTLVGAARRHGATIGKI